MMKTGDRSRQAGDSVLLGEEVTRLNFGACAAGILGPSCRPILLRCGSQVVRPSSAKALFGGSIPPRTSTQDLNLPKVSEASDFWPCLGLLQSGSQRLSETDLRTFIGGAVAQADALRKQHYDRFGLFTPVSLAFWATCGFNSSARRYAQTMGLWYLNGVSLAQLALRLGLTEADVAQCDLLAKEGEKQLSAAAPAGMSPPVVLAVSASVDTSLQPSEKTVSLTPPQGSVDKALNCPAGD